MVIGVTGHRPDKLGNEWDGVGPISDFVRTELQKQIDCLNPDCIITGMALGVDTIFAELAIKNNIPIQAALPFRGQQSKWSQQAQEKYFEILQHPMTRFTYVCEPGYAVWKMYKRNQWIVENCDILIAVWDGSSGGTSICIEWARKKRTGIVLIDLKEAFLIK